MNAVSSGSFLRALRGSLFFMLVLLFSTRASATPLRLGERSGYDLAGHMDLLKDPSIHLGFPEALKASEAGRFGHIDGNLNNGYKREACWVRFTVERNAAFPERGWLRLKPNYVNELTLYILMPGKDPGLPSSYRRVLLGNHVPVLQRPVLHPDFVVPVDLPASGPVVIYARVFSNSSISLAGRMHTAEELRDYTNLHIIIQSAFLGIAFAVLLINLVFYFSIRESLFLYFSVFIIGGIVYNFAAEGDMTLLFPSIVHVVSDYLIYGGIGANILIYSEFSRKLFASVAGSWSLRYMRFLSLVGVLTMAAVPLGFYPVMAPIAFLGTLILVVVQMVLSIRMRTRVPRIGLFILVAFAISTIGYFHMLLTLMGLLPLGSLWGVNTVQPANLLHMVLISIALSERLRISEQAAAESACQALEASRGTEQKARALANEMTLELRNSKTRLEVALASERIALEQKQRFFSMLSHEYRTPLAVVRGSLDIIGLQESGKQGGYEEELSAMHHAVDRLVEVMEVSLERSRLLEPGLHEELTRELFGPFLFQQVETMQAMWPQRTFIYTGAADHGYVVCDWQNLKTAIFNLLDNARKYSPPDSPVEVETRIEQGAVVTTIQNQSEPFLLGAGDALFDKYTRGGNSHETSGAGIGLWLVRQIIEQHDGTVSLFAKGSRIEVVVRLPIADDDGELLERQPSGNQQTAHPEEQLR
ncbi:MAG: sensor histidine kinase [Chlorobiaceae bacterium]|nr:sensor histidine kinase [Chlorobiaceae bacterium]